MKKYIIYAVLIIAGIFVGSFIFSSPKSAMINETSAHLHLQQSVNQEMWTCSMHPQIMQPEPGDCPICGMDLIPAATVSEGLAANEIKMTKNAMALANIQTTIVGDGATFDDDGMISLSGKIATNEENNAVQASYFDGRIEKLYVSYEGQKVNRGQLLATIYAPNLVATQQELLTTAALKESQPALYNAVRNKLKLWKLTDKQIEAIETSGKVRENFPIYATVSGTVAMVMAAEGDYVKQGQPILRVSNLNTVWAAFDAYENQISQFKKGQKIKVSTNAYAHKAFDATISFIDPVLNTATRTVTVRATLNNTEDLFKPGMFVTGKIEGATQTTSSETVTIPASAVLWTGERSLVYIKTHPNEAVFEMREVTLVNRSGENYQVVAGLNNGDEIVTNGTFTVDAAAQLQGKKSMMNRGKEVEVMAETTNMKIDLSAAFQKQLQQAIPSYLEMKDAFVASNAGQVSAFAKAALKEFKAIKAGDLGNMEKSHFEQSLRMLDAISNNENIENQREHFVILNENLIALAMNAEQGSNTLYVQKCPMANNNKGAIWLSAEKNIRNPYYGDAMLTCGSVIEEIK